MSNQKPSISVWDIPNFDKKLPDPSSTNAMGYVHGQTAPTEQEIEPELEPLTASALEEIRQAAYDEGLAQGQEEGQRQGLEQGRLQGLKEGHEEGLKQGLEQGFAQGAEQIAQQVARWNSLLLPLTQPLRELNHQVAEQMVALVGDLCQQLLKVELILNDKLLLQLLNEAIDTLPKQQNLLQIKLHPDDLILIQAHYSSEEQEKRGWVLCAEPTLVSGVCEVNTELSSVRNDIHSRMQLLVSDFIARNSQAEPTIELVDDFELAGDSEFDLVQGAEAVPLIKSELAPSPDLESEHLAQKEVLVSSVIAPLDPTVPDVSSDA